MATLDVIKSLRRKIDDKYEVAIPIGVEQRFVAPLRGINNNNLEEQLLLGTDLITKNYWLGSTFCETVEYRNKSVLNDYYIVERRSYNAAADAQFVHESTVFSTEAVYFVNNVSGKHGQMVVIESDLAEFQNNDTTLAVSAMFDDDPTNDGLDEEGYRKVLEEILYYKNSSGNTIEVAVRTTSEKEEDGITYTKSIIENKI